MSASDKPLKMVTCSGCEAKVFIPGDLPPLSTEPCKRCGYPIMMPMQLRQFELRSKIASGGHGKVYRAFDTVLERLVAVKLMRKELENDPVALEASTVKRAPAPRSTTPTSSTSTRLMNSRGSATWSWSWRTGAASIRASRSSAPRRTRSPGYRVQDRLGPGHGPQAQPAPPRHQAGQYPLQRRRRAQAGGFRPGPQRRSRTRIRVGDEGTPYYVAPEKIKRERETFLSDMYSLGCTLYHALTGHVPFEAPSVEELVAAHVHTALTPPNLVVPEITPADQRRPGEGAGEESGRPVLELRRVPHGV